MINSKLFYILIALEEGRGEIKKLSRFVSSSYFEKNKEVNNLFDYLKEFWPLSKVLRDDRLDKQFVFGVIFPEEEYNAQKINGCISKLIKLLEKYLVIRELEDKDELNDLMLLKALSARKIKNYQFGKGFGKPATGIKRTSNQGQNLSAESYLFQMYKADYDYFLCENNHYADPKVHDLLQETMDSLDRFALMKKLEIACEMKAREAIFGKEFQFRLPKNNPLIYQDLLKDDFVFQAYKGIWELFHSKNLALVEPLIMAVTNILVNSPYEKKLKLFTLLANAIPNHPDKISLFFDLYQIALKQGILMEGAHISPDHFNNIIEIGSSLEKHEWVKDFSKKYAKKLNPKGENKQNVESLFNAYLNFYDKDYKNAFKAVQDIKFSDVSYGLRRYILLFKILVDSIGLQEFREDLFSAYSKSFSVYINTQFRKGKINISLKKANTNFLAMTKKIYNEKTNKLYQTKYDKINLVKQLQITLDGFEEITHKGWLQTKINQVKKDSSP